MDHRAYFLGPQAENSAWLRSQVEWILDHWFEWRRSHFPRDGKAIPPSVQVHPEFAVSRAKVEKEIEYLMSCWNEETPKFTPRYFGHMVSDISIPAFLGSVLALVHNPNNASKEVSKIGTRIEREAIRMLSEMIGFDQEAVGHFTSGGTIANIEALWRARYWLDHRFSLGLALVNRGEKSVDSLFEWSMMTEKAFKELREKYNLKDEELRQYSFVANSPWAISQLFEHHKGKTGRQKFFGPIVLVPGNKHYSWQKATSLLGFGEEALWPIKLDDQGRLDVRDLDDCIRRARDQMRPIALVVSALGTTELGEVDPIDEVQNCLDRWKKRGIEICITLMLHMVGIFALFEKAKPFLQKFDPPLSACIVLIQSRLIHTNSVTFLIAVGQSSLRIESTTPFPVLKHPIWELKSMTTFGLQL